MDLEVGVRRFHCFHRLTPGDIDIVGVSHFLQLTNSIFKKIFMCNNLRLA